MNRKQLFPYALITPAMLVMLVIIFIPIIQTSVMSLFNYIIWKPRETRFIGLANYLDYNRAYRLYRRTF